MTHVWLCGYVSLAPFLGGLIGSTNRKKIGRVVVNNLVEGYCSSADSKNFLQITIQCTRHANTRYSARRVIFFFFRASCSSRRKYVLAKIKTKSKGFSLDCFEPPTRGKGTGAVCKKEATQFQK